MAILVPSETLNFEQIVQKQSWVSASLGDWIGSHREGGGGKTPPAGSGDSESSFFITVPLVSTVMFLVF